MFNKIPSCLIVLLSLMALTSCDSNSKTTAETPKKVEGRWYTSSQVIRGKKVFKDNCAVCHGDKGQGLVRNWKGAQADGSFPPPPLNGSAHTWHHSKDILMRTVNNGGIPLGGTMPSFKDVLNDIEKEAVLAHVMSLWPDQVYQAWLKRYPQ